MSRCVQSAAPVLGARDIGRGVEERVPAVAIRQHTPMMQQYLRVKHDDPDTGGADHDGSSNHKRKPTS